MMRKLLMMLVMMTSFAATVKADALSYTKEHPLLFGIDMDYPPMQFIDTDGKANGYDVEFTRELLKHLDIPFTYAPNAWANIADDILEVDIRLRILLAVQLGALHIYILSTIVAGSHLESTAIAHIHLHTVEKRGRAGARAGDRPPVQYG